jgi:S-adenosylmethionine decarboxylase
MSKPYGNELILDLHLCDTTKFNRKDIKRYFEDLCKLINMKREDLHFWDYEGDPEGYKAAPVHLKGTTAVQFISTSNIVIHTVDDMRNAYINIFSCREFNPNTAQKFTMDYFKGLVVKAVFTERK